MDAMRNMLAELMTDDGQLESRSAALSAAVGERAAEAERTAVGQSPAGAGPIAARQTIFRDGGLREIIETGHREAAVPSEVGLGRGQPDKPGRAGEMGACLIEVATNQTSRDSVNR